MAPPAELRARTAGLTSAISIFPSEFLSYFCMNAFIFSPKLSLLDVCGKTEEADFATGSPVRSLSVLPTNGSQDEGTSLGADQLGQTEYELTAPASKASILSTT